MPGDRFDIGVSHRRLMVLAVVCIGLVAGFGIGLLVYAWGAVDGIEQRRETQLVQRAVARDLAHIGSELMTVSVWQETFDHTLPPFDRKWAHENFGEYFKKSFGHDAAVLFGPDGQPVYASRNGEMRKVETEAVIGRAVQAMAAKARDQEMAHRFDPAGHRRMGFTDASVVTGVVRAGADIYLVAAAPIIPEASDPTPHRPASVIVTARRMGATYLKALEADLGTQEPRVVATASPGAGLPLVNTSGQTIGALEWRPHRPGWTVLSRVSVPATATFAVLVALVATIMMRVGRILQRLRDNDEALARSLSEVKVAHAAAQSASQAKSQFLANMSHEIRTPLNGVLGMAQLMATDPLDLKQQERVQIIRSSGERLLLILNDILDLSRIEAGRIELVESRFDLEQLLSETCAMFQMEAAAKGLDLDIDCGESACGVWFGDRLRVGQIVANLVSNAVKFTPQGSVRVAAAESGGELVIAVTDTGVGISERDLEGLFSKFTQVDDSDTRQFGGVGLGLAIVRELLNRMGGDVVVDSREGCGSAFRVRLPLSRPQAPLSADSPPPAEPSPAEIDRALKVLAVEDNPVNRMLLVALLEPLQLDIEMVEDGAQAVEAFQPGRYDLVLMDVQMPLMDGVTATRKIRTMEAAEPHLPRTPVIMLTANVMAHQLQGYADAGADGCVAKPIRLPELMAAMEAALDGGEDQDAQTKSCEALTAT